ncbi:iron complex transport system permease protein [Chromobacterium alkanivorans]|uniref:FecCD family ABC transporter permease n=1 Tax=Chromobacterium alkanivorans TaxID=1071719 RepID=UPI0021684EB2|nr:iron complex transport system permease protein [Chromobacterium alkanivorans]MCS3819249.1 iron complex transport system permease protein [Chromobacterium alkanivorans]MCS3873761.1 iron complex transport system permease protein [Chromobacterium alkanivorans]
MSALTIDAAAPNRGRWLLLGLIAASLLLPLLALSSGGNGLAWPDFSDPLLTQLRLPRIAAALGVGAALAASGAALQALFRNPLADPGLIGTSSGAALAVVSMLAIGAAGLSLPLAAFGGGLLATWLILLLSRLVRGGLAGLLLMGLVVGAFCGAVTSLMIFMSDDLTLRAATSWLAGNLSSASSERLLACLGVAGLGLLILIAVGRDLDCLLLGEDAARSLGIDVRRTRRLTAVGAALATGGAVALSGVIGFVGMMIPNALALLLGGCRRRLILLSAWAGALFLLAVDTLARTIAWPIDLPVGLMAAFAGPPFFVWLFRRQQRSLING